MGLVAKQNRFALCLGLLYLEIERRGMVYTLGDCYRSPEVFGGIGERKGYGHPSSCHKYRLAQDINLFDADGGLIDDNKYHKELHAWWVVNCCGAPMIPHDSNHYSFAHNGCI